MTVSPTASRRAGSELRCVAPRRTSLPPFSQAAIVGFLELHLHPGLGLHSHLVGARALLRLGQADLDLPVRRQDDVRQVCVIVHILKIFGDLSTDMASET